MNKPTLVSGIIWAVGLTGIGYAIFTVTSIVLHGSSAATLTLLSVASIYCIYLIWALNRKSGRIVVGLAMLLLPFLALLFSVRPMTALIVGVSSIWIMRSLLSYKSLLSTLLDAVLCAVAVLVALAAFIKSGSLAVAIWTFFLIQSLFVLIPTRLEGFKKEAKVQSMVSEESVRFNQAYRSAQVALERLSVE